MQNRIIKSARHAAPLLGLLVLGGTLGGCGEQAQAPAASSSMKYDVPTAVAGEVRVDKQVVKKGRIDVADASGNKIISGQWENSPRFTLTVPAGAHYPLELTAHPDDPEVASKAPLILVITRPGTDQQITSASTHIAHKAKQMGGYSPENLTSAAMSSAVPPDAASIGGGTDDHH